VIGGNVSFYNESGGRDIDPTPVVGLLGLVEALEHRPPGIGWREGATLILLGAREVSGSPVPYPLGGSRWAVELRGHRGGRLPELDASSHRPTVDLVRSLVAETVSGGEGLLCGVHDVSAGGIGVAVAEMAVRAGVGCTLSVLDGHAELFTEHPSRFLVASMCPDDVLGRAASQQVPAKVLGRAGGDRLVMEGLVDVELGSLTLRWREAIPGALAQG